MSTFDIVVWGILACVAVYAVFYVASMAWHAAKRRYLDVLASRMANYGNNGRDVEDGYEKK